MIRQGTVIVAACLWSALANAQFGPAPQVVVPAAVTARAPILTDDINAGYQVGHYFVWNGSIWQNQINTAAASTWQMLRPQFPADALPYTQTITGTGGSGFVLGDTVNFSNGASGTVTTATGPVVSATKTCTPTTGTVTVSSTSGSGTGGTYTAATPAGWVKLDGTRRLSSCYSGSLLAVEAVPTGVVTNIGYRPDGSLDLAALSALCSAPITVATPWLSKQWCRATPIDQTSYANNDTVAAAVDRPAIDPTVLVGNSPSLMFPNPNLLGYPVTGGPFGLVMPAGVSVPEQNFFTAYVARALHSTTYTQVFATLGSGSTMYEAASIGSPGSGCGVLIPSIATITNAENALLSPFVGTVNSNATALTATCNGFSAASGAAAPSGTITGGFIGSLGASTAGDVEMGAFMESNRAATATEVAAVQAALNLSFGLAPQTRGVILALGDSETDGNNSSLDQGWFRKLEPLLAFPARLYNGAHAGWTSAQVQSELPNYVGIYSATNAFNIATLQIGGNDTYVSGTAAATTYSNITSIVASLHTSGFKVFCGTSYFQRGATTPQNNIEAALNALTVANSAGCDKIVDLASNAILGPVAGINTTYSPDGQHPWDVGQTIEAQMWSAAINASGYLH